MGVCVNSVVGLRFRKLYNRDMSFFLTARMVFSSRPVLLSDCLLCGRVAAAQQHRHNSTATQQDTLQGSMDCLYTLVRGESLMRYICFCQVLVLVWHPPVGKKKKKRKKS